MADTAEGRTCGIQRPADRGEWFAGLTFARGTTPDELAARLGAVPGVRPGPLGAPAAWSMATQTADGEGVARVGSWGGWSCEPVCCFGPGEECRRGGHRPDFLLPELVAAGVLGPDGANAGPDDEPDEDRERRTLAVLETPLRTGPAAAPDRGRAAPRVRHLHPPGSVVKAATA
ncbi:hypothetical protein ABZY34_16460 [Streptomyces virginiae]|uniref:hypothetical protein n=1 Tax=Streptomyces virginiae TaxID=1961 RepID=UPI0033B8C654